MSPIHFTDLIIRKLNPDEAVPYELLLLADPSKPVIDTYLKNSDVYIAQLNGQTIAVYVLCRVDDDATSIEIKNIAVDTKFQNQGLGKYLLADATEKAKQKGFQSIIIGTANSSISQLHLYQQQGFEITRIKKDFFTKNYPEPVYENGILLEHMLMRQKRL